MAFLELDEQHHDALKLVAVVFGLAVLVRHEGVIRGGEGQGEGGEGTTKRRQDDAPHACMRSLHLGMVMSRQTCCSFVARGLVSCRLCFQLLCVMSLLPPEE